MTADRRSRDPANAPADGAPVWVLAGHRAGDRGQVLALARALGIAYEIRQLRFNPLHVLPNVVQGARLSSLARGSRPGIAPPWPKLVIGSGRRSVPVARWIREQSGGRTRLVQVGRPRAPLHLFDLVVTTPQYGLPDRPNVEHLLLPIQEPQARIAPQEQALWADAIAALPQPRIAVLAGGGSPPFRFGASEAADLGRRVSRLAERHGGSLLVTTSPRTGAAATAALRKAVSAPALVHVWEPGGSNPYQVFLDAADAIVVTGDSISMLAEACRTGRPVMIAEPRTSAAATALLAAGASFDRLWGRLADAGLLARPRDIRRVLDAVVDEGLAHWFREDRSIPPAGESRRLGRDMARVVARVRALVETPSQAG